VLTNLIPLCNLTLHTY